MAQVKFDRQHYSDHALGEATRDNDTIYFTPDTHQVIIGGQIYGNDVPKVRHELIYYDPSETSHNGLKTQQLMYEEGIVVENPQEYNACATTPEKPDIMDTFQQFSESPFCPEYGVGLSLDNNGHRTPYFNAWQGPGSGGYGYNHWQTHSTYKNVIYCATNSEEYNGFIYKEKGKRIYVESLMGSYKSGNYSRTSGDMMGISLINTNHAVPRHVIGSDGRTYYRDAMYDLDGTQSGNANYCAWVSKEGDGAYIIYSGVEHSTNTDFWTSAAGNSYNSSTGKSAKINTIVTFDPTYNQSHVDSRWNKPVVDMYKDSFPAQGTNYTVYYAAQTDTLVHRRTTTPSGIITISSQHDASGFIATLDVLTESATGIDAIFCPSYGAWGTIFVFTRLIPISGLSDPISGSGGSDSPSEHLSERTLFSYLRGSDDARNQVVGSSDTFLGDAYGHTLPKHQKIHIIGTDRNTHDGDGLVPYVAGNNTIYDQDSESSSYAIAIRSRLKLDNGILTIDFSKVGRSKTVTYGDSSKENYSDINNFIEADSTHTGNTGNALDWISKLTLNFRDKTYSINSYDEQKNVTNAPMKATKDSFVPNSDPIALTGPDRFNVQVVENGEVKTINIMDLFLEDVGVMYNTCSFANSAINCTLLTVNDRTILRSYDNTVWKLNDDRTDWTQDLGATALSEFTGSRLNYNDITKKLWYSTGSTMYPISSIGTNYSLPVASANELGGVKLFANTTLTGNVNAAVQTGTAERIYPVQLTNTNQMVVNVPWENTTYTLAGLIGSSVIGGATQPIYWTGSAFASTTYSLGKSVPSDALFTDTKQNITASTSKAYLTGVTTSPTSTAQALEGVANTGVFMQSGTITASDGFFQSSDARKKNVLSDLDLDKAYDLVDKCRTILYTMKDDESSKEQIGLIAQEVQSFFPEIVNTDDKGFLSLDYARLTVVILKVLKDLIARVSKLESK